MIYIDLKLKFELLNENFTELLGRVYIGITVLGSVMGKVSAVESNLFQIIKIQIDAASAQAAPNIAMLDSDSYNQVAYLLV